jgi:hypothetical protein
MIEFPARDGCRNAAQAHWRARWTPSDRDGRDDQGLDFSKEAHMKRVSVALIGAALHAAGIAGPFDLKMGMSVNELQGFTTLRPDGPYRFVTKTLPNGHPELADYRLTVTPVHGLCKVSASTAVIPADADGRQLQSAFDRLYGALTKRYGTSKRYDRLQSGSDLVKPNEWMTALLKKERTLTAYWTGQDLSLPDNISGIMLEVIAAGPSFGFVYLAYEFKNSSECLDWIQGRRSKQL